MSESFEPRNDLESKLVDTHEGRISEQAFIEILLQEQIFMPVLDEDSGIQGFQKSTNAHPLTLKEEGGAEVLILFTSPDRAKPFVQHYPGFEKGGLLTEFTWILERVGQGELGIAINPGWDIGIDFDPPKVASLAQQIAATETGENQSTKD